MTKAFDKIMRGLEEAKAHARGELESGTYIVHAPPAEVDVRAVRAKLHLSQEAFAARFGFTKSAIRDWEQKRRKPEGPARTLLKVIERNPEAVEEALRGVR